MKFVTEMKAVTGIMNYLIMINLMPFWSNTSSLRFCCLFRFAGEIISDGEANARDDDSYMFNLENKVSLDMILFKEPACK